MKKSTFVPSSFRREPSERDRAGMAALRPRSPTTTPRPRKTSSNSENGPKIRLEPPSREGAGTHLTSLGAVFRCSDRR